MYTKMLKPEIMSTILPEDFPADKLSQPQYSMMVEKDIFVTMRDGAHVAVDVYRPDADGKFPALLAASCYQKDLITLPHLPIFHMNETNSIEYFVTRGYAFVHMDVRGCGKSVEGQFQFLGPQEPLDIHDTIEWAAVQPWCTGKLGMIGESYLALTQWAAAAQQPAHLACIAPFDAVNDIYRENVYHGGLLAVGFITAHNAWEIRGHYRLGKVGPDPNVGSWDYAWNVINHPTYDDFWKSRAIDLKKIRCPVYSLGEWHKIGLHTRGNIRAYEEVDVPKKLLMCHGEVDGDEMAVFNSPEVRSLLLRWYDHWLKGNDTGFMEEPPVNIFIRGRETYRTEKEWPLARTEYRELYLRPGPSGAVESFNDGGLSWTEPIEESSSFSYHYPDPDWTHFSGGGSAVQDGGLIYPTRKILTFTSEPLTQDLEMIGSTILELYAASDQTDTHFLVRIWDQAPDKEQHTGMPPKGMLLTRGWLKASHACTKDEALSKPYRPYYRHDHPQPIEPGRVDKYEIEIWPTSNLFKAGHRIRLDVTCHDSPALDFGGHYYGLRVGNDTVFHDRHHPSRLILPIVPT